MVVDRGARQANKADRAKLKLTRLKKWMLVFSLLLITASTSPTHAQSGISGTEPREARGLVRSSARIEFRSDLRAPIAELPVREGQSFSKGDLLFAFDCSRYEAELNAARAGAEAARIDYKSKKRLLAHQAIGRDEVNLASAQADKASAEVNVREITNDECRFTAPFDGRVVALHSNVREYPPSDRPMIMIILDDNALEIEMVVPSNWLTFLKSGQNLQFKVDETGQMVAAIIDRIGAEVDPVSQTVKVFGKLKVERTGILAGMSGLVLFSGGS